MNTRAHPVQVVVMGVSGVGKSSVARAIRDRTGWAFVEADDLHSPTSIAKMTAGQPLTAEDRRPWLLTIRDRMRGLIAAGDPAVITCSALQRVHRDLLREAGPQVFFLHLVADEATLAERVRRRHDHFMPPSLLRSQFETLQPLEDDEPGVVISVESPFAQVLAESLAALGIPPR